MTDNTAKSNSKRNLLFYPIPGRWKTLLLCLALTLVRGTSLWAQSAGDSRTSLQPLDVKGELLVVICTKGQSTGPLAAEGMQLLADTAHKHGFPVTWLARPFAAIEAADHLKSWHKQYGDEVGWYSGATPLNEAEAEFNALKKATPWQTSIVSAGSVSYTKDRVDLWERLGIEAVWGRCPEQSDCDGICDRGSPHGFYYLRGANYKVPNDQPGGLISVPWCSSDPNMIFWTGLNSSLTFDPDEMVAMGFAAPGRSEAWLRMVDEFQKQSRFNKVVPLVVQQEYNARTLKPTVPYLEALFSYLKEKRIKVLPLREAVRRYKAAVGNSTPPTYGVYDNLGGVDIVRNPSPSRSFTFEMVDKPLREAERGAPFNGCYATHRIYQPRRKQLYYSPDGKKYHEHGRLFTFYDKNGLLLFDDSDPRPKRITSYLELPSHLTGFAMLPEMSFTYDTDKLIPNAVVRKTEEPSQVKINIAIEPLRANSVAKKRLAYGVMVWGDFSIYRLPEGLPEGSAIVGKDGLFVPFVLDVDTPATREIVLRK